MFTKRDFGRKENLGFGKKTQVALLALILISISISLSGITAYVTSGNTVSFQGAPTGPDLAVTSISINPQYPDINEYSTIYVTVGNLGKNITSYYSVYMSFGDGTYASFSCGSGNCFWKSGEYRSFQIPHSYSSSGSFNVSVNTYVAGDINSANNQKSILEPIPIDQ